MKNKIELTWPGKDKWERPEPRLLLEKSTYGTKKGAAENLLIHGDNLLGLKALEKDYAGKVKCVYIDPPYNTKSCFKHYDDSMEHSLWLNMMKERLVILRNLLREDGSIWISIDDDEYHYLKVLCDDIFGRKNYCGTFIWEKKRKPSFLNKNLGIVTEYIITYSKNRNFSIPFYYGQTTEGKKYPLNNSGNGLRVLSFPPGSVSFDIPDQVVQPQDMSEGNIITKLLDKLSIKNGKNVNLFRLEGEWRYSQKKLEEILRSDDLIKIAKIPFRPNRILSEQKPKKIKNLLSKAHYEVGTYEDAADESTSLFGSKNTFDYPKPEKLISFIINCASTPGDLILDCFAGSGTTGAVAHKMKRRWIMIEMNEHCNTHIAPRLQKVIDGKDLGGITEAVSWKGGGGFRYCDLIKE
jgi:adenine-specific DNA-methyltransferase